MARRILSAESALQPPAQFPLGAAPRQPAPPVLHELQTRWAAPAAPPVFDWQDRRALMAEIDLVNRAQTVLDEAAIHVAPSVLRIVLTVKENLPDPRAQRAFLGEHLQLDFRRVSELCIVAESYGLLDLERRANGAREIERYGWSIALKLAYVRDPHDRADLWERARAGRAKAAYRDVLDELRRFRERKLIAPPEGRANGDGNLPERLLNARRQFGHLDQLAQDLNDRAHCEQAVETLERLQRELNRIRRTLRDRLLAQEHQQLASSA
jgi:hypothetical protein